MIKLTDRLQKIADEINQNETMADIGTDHGFLPISLWEKGISPKVIMADISPGSLEKARQNGSQRYPQEQFDLRLGSGIQVLKSGEVDAVVIAGMGGILMTEILKEDLPKSHSFGKFVLQPRSGQGRLRYWLTHHGFGITRENLVREGKYICEILTARPLGNNEEINLISRDMPGCEETDIEYEVPPWIAASGPLAKPFVQNKLSIEQRIFDNLAKGREPDTDKIQRTGERILYLEELLGGM